MGGLGEEERVLLKRILTIMDFRVRSVFKWLRLRPPEGSCVAAFNPRTS
jgi:hypothetical protein